MICQMPSFFTSSSSEATEGDVGLERFLKLLCPLVVTRGVRVLSGLNPRLS